MSDDKTRILTAEDAARLAAPAADSDDRTRVLSAEEAARVLARAKPASDTDGVSNPPRLVGDKIVFFCSNGHRIAVDRSLAGKRGNCSKQGCGVPVVIPIPPGLDVRPGTAARAERGPAGEAPPGAEPPAGPVAGAASAFDFEAQPEAAAAAPGSPPPAPPPVEASRQPPEAGAETPSWDFFDGGPRSGNGDQASGAEIVAGGWAPDVGEIDHPAARLVARLWQERAHGGIVEVHLAGGGVIMPEFYDPRWSCGGHAVFAALAPDNTVTLTAVAWDQVQRIVVRQVQGKPDGMFGE